MRPLTAFGYRLSALGQRAWLAALLVVSLASTIQAEEPVAAYIFPAGGQRGTTVQFKVGGLFLNQQCGFEMRGPSVEASRELKRTRTVWFEGPLIPLPDSQQAEDYPKDMAGQVRIDAEATLGVRPWRVWTSQGVTPSRSFVIGDLPEVVEAEIDGEPVPVGVQLPVTVNGRIFPREDADVWSFAAKRGQAVTCVVDAAGIGSPLDARIEIIGKDGRRLAESDDAQGDDPQLRFIPPADGACEVRIHDIQFRGGQAYVYRLTITAEPWIEAVFPLGGRRGSKMTLVLQGQGVPSTAEVDLPSDAGSTFIHRLPLQGKLTNPFALEVDDLPEHVEPAASPLGWPAILNGRIGAPGETDAWPVILRKGETFDLDLGARRLGSPLCATILIKDGGGKELARADTPGTDPTLRFTAPSDGVYQIVVAERFRSRGGPRFAYRLRIDRPAAQDFRLTMATDALNLPRGGKASVKVTAQRLNGFNEPIALTVEGMPAGVTVAGATIPAGQIAADLAIAAKDSARIQISELTIRGTAKAGERNISRTVTPLGIGVISAENKGLTLLARLVCAQHTETLALAVTPQTPFKIVGDFHMQWAPRGGRLTHHYRIERNNFNGPIEVTLTDRQARHLQGVTGPTITVPAGATEFRYTVQLSPRMEIGRTCRVCVMGSATITDVDGSPQVVTYSSVNQNDQLVAVIEAGKLGLELGRSTLLARPGQTANLTVQITRSKLVKGAVRVELAVPEHTRGISAEAVIIPAGQSSATISVRFANHLSGPLNMPLTVRATTLEAGKHLLAEAELGVVR